MRELGEKVEIGVLKDKPFDGVAFEKAVKDMLLAAGFDINSSHLSKTHKRVRQLWEERLLSGYNKKVGDILGTGFTDERDDLVIVKGISISGTCPHHLVPFRGVAHVGYQPGGRLHGFGRIARLVDALANRLTYQEWLTRDIAEALVTHGHALGAACWIETEQMCLLLGENRRGDERVNSSAFVGSLAEADLKQEFLSMVNG